ncbi:MAG: NAD(P)-binding domain-containing protein [Gemmatimonadetes bacterium]|nr:NAD(P)-binding domain-containing protein [Gemmatimonadota bacterium]
MGTDEMDRLPVVVIGAGPIGLAAAVHLVMRGEEPLVLEAGDGVGTSIRKWSHVALFSSWKYLMDPIASRMLESQGWRMPDPETAPTGGEFVERYLEPLAALPEIASRIQLNARATALSRRGYDKVKSAGRDEVPFELMVRRDGGVTEKLLARAVIDASGTYESPNPLGANGLRVAGEDEAVEWMHYRIPDVRGRDRARFAGRRTVVVGSGHSAFNSLIELAELAREEPGTEVIWAIRRQEPLQLFGGGERDALPVRGALGARVRLLTESGIVKMETAFRATDVVRSERGIVIVGDGRRMIGPVDEVVVATGFRPELSLTRELRLSLDSWLESPVQLATLIDPNEHSCGTVYPHGAVELSHPEKGYYAVGMKSYGRAPTFLMLTGYEQVRSVACMLTGDEIGAREVHLVLPETGVCSTSSGGSSCCALESSATPAPLPGSCGIGSACAGPVTAPAIGGVILGAADGCCA